MVSNGLPASGKCAGRMTPEIGICRTEAMASYWSSFARYSSGFSLILLSQPGQHRKTSRSFTVTLYGVPIAPSGLPLTGQTFSRGHNGMETVVLLATQRMAIAPASPTERARA